MDKEFIPYEQALALKELGFNKRTFAAYNTIQGDKWILTPDLSGEGQYPKSTSACIAPTFSQAFRFFREKYELGHNICPYYFNANITELQDVDDYPIQHDVYVSSPFTYEQTELECLKKLIEIAKQK
jgi:hypothetical protein